MILSAHAKINIGLKVINRRPDGFHNIETIFYPVKLSDEITINISKSSRDTNSVIIKTNNKVIPTDKTNLCFKVIESFFRTFSIRDFYIIEISVIKNIPVGGGLGGGSSDAAMVLRYLTKYFNFNVSDKRKEMLGIALSVGSDVPFFLINKPCFAQGRGEIITKLENFTLDDYNILLVNPNLHISTKWAFENLDLQNTTYNSSKISDIHEFSPAVFTYLKNDFEEVVFNKYPELETVKSELQKYGAEFSSMSGSGATMYGLFKKSDTQSIRTAYDYYKQKNYFAYIS